MMSGQLATVAASSPLSNRESGDPPARNDLRADVDLDSNNAGWTLGEPRPPEFLGLALDKLRVVGWLRPSVDPQAAIDQCFGLTGKQTRPGRNVGPRRSFDFVGFSGERGARGAVWHRIRVVEGWPSEVCVEFNPAAVGESHQRMLGAWWSGICGVQRAWLRRVDAAFDFRGSRWSMLLDDSSGRRRVDRFGCWRDGCETEQCGMSKGSEFGFRLYDKSKERKFRGDEDSKWDGVVRFEQQWRPKLASAPDLADLASVAWPDEAGVRWLAFDPARVRDNVHRLLLLCGVHGGMCCMRPEVRLCLNRLQRERFWGSLVPPLPVGDLFRQHWPTSVRRDLAGFLSCAREAA